MIINQIRITNYNACKHISIENELWTWYFNVNFITVSLNRIFYNLYVVLLAHVFYEDFNCNIWNKLMIRWIRITVCK